MKRFGFVAIGILALVLAGCSQLSFDSDSSGATSGTKKGSYQTTGTVDNSMYQGVIRSGRYQTSSARGLTIRTNTQNSNYNVKSMENGLLTMSKQEFPTTKYLFEEGQLISTGTAEDWLGRKSNADPDGLNPADDGKKNLDERKPKYLNTMLEQDFMVQNGQSLKLGGISIALGMNEYYYYQRVKNGPTYTKHIDQADLATQGQEMAKEVVSRLRQMKGVGANIPITVALYKNASQDALIGGVFFRSVTSKSGNSLGTWKAINQQNQMLPTVENQKPINSTVATDFSNFQNQIENFFPTLAGVTAQTHYEGGQLTGMNITVNTQFYGETEIESFTQYIATSARRDLPAGVKIEITIQSTAGVQSFVARNAGDKGFYTHVFGSY